MIRINIHEAKVHLSRYLAKLNPGERLLICRRNMPVAELRRLPKEVSRQRPVGLMRGLFVVPRDFNDPLPEEELAAWYKP